MAVSLPAVAESTNHLRQVKESANASLRINGAKVSTEDQGGKRAIQTAKVVSILKLDIEIKGFSRKGDRVWDVRIYGARDLTAVIWVHSETAATKFLVP